MPDGLPPSDTKHVGVVGASRTVSSNENRQEREKVRDSYSWRLLRFLEVCFLFYLPSGCLCTAQLHTDLEGQLRVVEMTHEQ